MDDYMNNNELYFSVKDTIQDVPVDLDNLSLPIIAELAEFVMKFIKGSSSVDLSGVKVAVKNGSVAVVVPPTPIIASAVADYREIKTSGKLDNIDPIRAKIIADLQEKARKNPSKTYTISDTSDAIKIASDSISVTNDSDYRITLEDQWVQTETYIYGKVYDMGGKTKSNVHLTLQNGDTIKLDADANILADDDNNRLYKDQLIRIRAEQNLRTKKLRKEALISFEKYEPHFNEDEFQATVAKVKTSWADVSDIVAWVEDVRGNYAQSV